MHFSLNLRNQVSFFRKVPIANTFYKNYRSFSQVLLTHQQHTFCQRHVSVGHAAS